MEAPTEFHDQVYAMFRKEFGEPNHTVGKDNHWSLKSPPYGTPINVLVNGTLTQPVAWIFDPFDPEDGVFHAAINSEAEAQEIIRQIRERMARASHTHMDKRAT